MHDQEGKGRAGFPLTERRSHCHGECCPLVCLIHTFLLLLFIFSCQVISLCEQILGVLPALLLEPLRVVEMEIITLRGGEGRESKLINSS